MQKCQKCGADMVQNPKTGKIFCKDKCWLNGQTTQSFSSQVAQTKMEDNKWDKISFGKCKHAFLLEAFKKGDSPSPETEKQCEEWARMSMRISAIGDRQPQTQSAPQNTSATMPNDEIYVNNIF
jgi:hypothetical protein